MEEPSRIHLLSCMGLAPEGACTNCSCFFEMLLLFQLPDFTIPKRVDCAFLVWLEDSIVANSNTRTPFPNTQTLIDRILSTRMGYRIGPSRTLIMHLTMS